MAHPHPPSSPLCAYQTEDGASINLQAGKARIRVDGLDDAEAAEEVGTAILLVLARRKNVLPRLTGERTPGELLRRIREAP